MTGSPIHFKVRSGDMITIQWSGELRTVVIETTDGDVIIRDLTDAENRQLEEDLARAEADQ